MSTAGTRRSTAGSAAAKKKASEKGRDAPLSVPSTPDEAPSSSLDLPRLEEILSSHREQPSILSELKTTREQLEQAEQLNQGKSVQVLAEKTHQELLSQRGEMLQMAEHLSGLVAKLRQTESEFLRQPWVQDLVEKLAEVQDIRHELREWRKEFSVPAQEQGHEQEPPPQAPEPEIAGEASSPVFE